MTNPATPVEALDYISVEARVVTDSGANAKTIWRLKEKAEQALPAAQREAEVKAMLVEALEGLTKVINAAGLLNLSNGVQLGSTVWYVKASDAMTYADMALEAAQTSTGGAE